MSDNLGLLVADVARLVRKRFDERARAIGVTRAQWRALSAVSRNEGINQGGLAELLEVEPITLCRMVDRLADADLVERRRDPADRRAWQLYLTPRAHPLVAQLRDLADTLFARVLADFSEAQQHQLTALLERLRANLHSLPADQEAAHG